MYYIIYGITDCPSCLRAQADLMEKDLEYAFVECDFSKQYRNWLKKKYNWSTFPMIILVKDQKEVFIGGREQLTESLYE